MINKVESNIFRDISSWVAVNMLAIFLIGSSYFYSSRHDRLPSILNNVFVDQALEIAENFLIFGGGVFIASCQWLFLKHLRPQISNGGWAWVLSGLGSSIPAFCVLGILFLGSGEYRIRLYDLLFSFLIVSVHMILLSIVQGFLLHRNQYNGVGPWVIINILGHGLIFIS